MWTSKVETHVSDGQKHGSAHFVDVVQKCSLKVQQQ